MMEAKLEKNIKQKTMPDFSFFKKITHIFSSQNNEVIIEPIPEKESIPSDPRDKKINQLIASDLLTMVYDISQQGYELSLEQKKAFEDKMQSNMNKKQYIEVEELLRRGYEFSNEFILNYIYAGENGERFAHAINSCQKERWGENGLAQEMLKIAIDNNERYLIKIKTEGISYRTKKKTEFNTFKEEQTICALLNNKLLATYFQFIQPYVTLEEYMSLVLVLKEIESTQEKLIKEVLIKEGKKIESYKIRNYQNKIFENDIYDLYPKNTLENYLKNNFKNEKELLVAEMGPRALETYLSEIVENNTQINSAYFNFNKFPQELKPILLEVSKKINQCHIEKKYMEESTWEKVEKLWKNQLSKSLELYLDMSKEYHTTPSVQNKNADLLLVESIQNIHEILDIELQTIYEYKLRELSVIHRQTEEIKKNHRAI